MRVVALVFALALAPVSGHAESIQDRGPATPVSSLTTAPPALLEALHERVSNLAFAAIPHSPAEFDEQPGSPRQTSPRYLLLDTDESDTTVREQAWLVPYSDTTELERLRIVAELLAAGETSLLGRALVVPGLARDVSSRLVPRTGAALLSFIVVASRAGMATNLDDRIDASIARLAQHGPTPGELSSAVGPTGTFVSAEIVRRIAQQYLTRERRIVVEMAPRGAPEVTRPKPLQRHSVVRAESLSKIAERYGTTVAELARVNRLDTKKAIRPGQKLELPGRPRPRQIHWVRAGETLASIARRYGVGPKSLARANRLEPGRPLSPGRKLVIVR